ncbi:MAG: tetratricopeptide repeat protein [Chthoniobacterales bacterium]
MTICFRLLFAMALLAAVPKLSASDVILNVDNPATAVAAANKANDLEKKGDLKGAIGYYSAAIKIDPGMYVAVYSRGVAYMQLHQWDQAISDFGSALRISPSFMLAGIKRAEVNQITGHYDKALAELNHIIQLHPRIHTDAMARSGRSWIYATCPNSAFRNGKQAVADATAACKIDAWDSWDYIDTLAAAHAEAGDFEKAIKFESKAIRKLHNSDAIKSAQERLALYQQQKPYRVAASH